jgi:hypothetical protein
MQLILLSLAWYVVPKTSKDGITYTFKNKLMYNHVLLKKDWERGTELYPKTLPPYVYITITAMSATQVGKSFE